MKPPWTGITSKFGAREQRNFPPLGSGTCALIAGVLLAGAVIHAFHDARANAPATAGRPFSQHDTDVFPVYVPDSKIPQIEARSYNIEVLKMSESQRTYLFADPSGAKPGVGRILLLRRGGEPVMALRVLRTEIEKKRFFAKRVRRYGNHSNLPEGEAYDTVERVIELALPPPTEQDELDMRELDMPYYAATTDANSSADAMLDEGMGGAPSNDPSQDGLLDDTGGTGLDGPVSVAGDDDFMYGDYGRAPMSIQEIEPMDKLNHSISAQAGFFSGQVPAGTSAYFSGMGLRYGITLSRLMLLKRSKAQDSLVLEGGLFLYRVLGYESAGDSYTVLPMLGTLRYNMFLNPTLGIHIYAGVVKNNVIGSVDSTDTALATLGKTGPALGGGLLFKLGPHWDARVDLGMDMIGAGLMVSF